MIAKSLILTLAAMSAALVPLPPAFCPPECFCTATIKVEGQSITGGTSNSVPMNDVAGYANDSAKVFWSTTGGGQGPTDGICNYENTSCSECTETQCRFFVTFHCDIATWGSLPSGDSYAWNLAIPGPDPGGSIDGTTGEGNPDTADHSLDCDTPTTGFQDYDFEIWRTSGTGSPELIFTATLSVKCADCDPS